MKKYFALFLLLSVIPTFSLFENVNLRERIANLQFVQKIDDVLSQKKTNAENKIEQIRNRFFIL